MKSKQTTRKSRPLNSARINQLKSSAVATIKKTGISNTRAVRVLAGALKQTPRREFIAVFTAKPFGLSANTVSTQLHRGRA